MKLQVYLDFFGKHLVTCTFQHACHNIPFVLGIKVNILSFIFLYSTEQSHEIVLGKMKLKTIKVIQHAINLKVR